MPEYICTRLAPAFIISPARRTSVIPPTPIIGSFPSVAFEMYLTISSDFSKSGLPLSPPVFSYSGRSAGRETVVLVAHIPSSFNSSRIESIASISSNERSGAIFNIIGMRATPSFFALSSFALEIAPKRFGRKSLP